MTEIIVTFQEILRTLGIGKSPLRLNYFSKLFQKKQ